MGTMAIYSQPLVSFTDDGSSSSSSSSSSECLRRIACSADARLVHPCGDILGGGSVRRGKQPVSGGDDDEATAYLQRCETAPGYVSFEDVIGTTAFREGSPGARPPGAGISDPLVRTASRLYAREAAHQPRRRRRSPGPLGTRRGSAMHGLVKKYVHPFLGFLAGIFCLRPRHQ